MEDSLLKVVVDAVFEEQIRNQQIQGFHIGYGKYGNKTTDKPHVIRDYGKEEPFVSAHSDHEEMMNEIDAIGSERVAQAAIDAVREYDKQNKT